MQHGERGAGGWVAVGTVLRHLGLGPPPAQIPACGTTAPGSYLGFLTRKRSAGSGCMAWGSGSHVLTILIIFAHVRVRS